MSAKICDLTFASEAVNVSRSQLMAADLMGTGGRLNKKDGLTRYGDSHVKDKTS